MLRNAALRLVDEGTLSHDRWKELVVGMTVVYNAQIRVVAHCRMHQLIAKKPGVSNTPVARLPNTINGRLVDSALSEFRQCQLSGDNLPPAAGPADHAIR